MIFKRQVLNSLGKKLPFLQSYFGILSASMNFTHLLPVDLSPLRLLYFMKQWTTLEEVKQFFRSTFITQIKTFIFRSFKSVIKSKATHLSIWPPVEAIMAAWDSLEQSLLLVIQSLHRACGDSVKSGCFCVMESPLDYVLRAGGHSMICWYL